MSDPTVLFMCTECGFSVDTEDWQGEDCEDSICAPCLRKMPRKLRPKPERRTYSARRVAAVAVAFTDPTTLKRRLRF